MRRTQIILISIFLLFLSSCSVVTGIFKAGVGVGVIIVIVILAIIVFAVTRAKGK